MSETVFTPTEEWQLNDQLTFPIQEALDDMNQKDSKFLIERLRREVKSTDSGVIYAVLKGFAPDEYSDTDALVMFNPFANGASDNMLVRAEFVREVAKHSDVRDDKGKLKPVVMLASPSLSKGSKFKLNEDERARVKKGELGPVASKLLRAVTEEEFGRVSLLGFSQGADVALAGSRYAFGANLDAESLVIGDPVGEEDRKFPVLMSDFFKAGTKQLKQSVEATKSKALNKAQDGPLGLLTFGGSFLIPNNLRLYKGMGVNTFESRIQEVLNEGIVDKLVVGYGSNDAITKPNVIEPALQRLYEKNGTESITSIKVIDGNHTWGDQLTLLSKLYMLGE